MEQMERLVLLDHRAQLDQQVLLVQLDRQVVTVVTVVTGLLGQLDQLDPLGHKVLLAQLGQLAQLGRMVILAVLPLTIHSARTQPILTQLKEN